MLRDCDYIGSAEDGGEIFHCFHELMKGMKGMHGMQGMNGMQGMQGMQGKNLRKSAVKSARICVKLTVLKVTVDNSY